MRTLPLLPVVLITSLLAAPAVLGQDRATDTAQDAAPAAAPDDGTVTLEAVSGRTYQGKVLSVSGGMVELQTGDGATVKLPEGTLTPQSQYAVRRGQATDGKSRMALAEWCVDNKLYEQARTQYKQALASDASLAPQINASAVDARKRAANEMLQRAESLLAGNKQSEARQVLSTLVQELPLEPAAKKAAALLAAENAQRQQNAFGRDAYQAVSGGGSESGGGSGSSGGARTQASDFSQETQEQFAPIIRIYKDMLTATQKGLAAGGSEGIDEFQKALRQAKDIRSMLGPIRQNAAEGSETAEALTLVDAKLEEADVEARLDLVNCYLIRTSYVQASDVVREGLAVYPKNAQLKQSMDRITDQNSNSSGGGWIFGANGVRGPVVNPLGGGRRR